MNNQYARKSLGSQVLNYSFTYLLDEHKTKSYINRKIYMYIRHIATSTIFVFIMIIFTIKTPALEHWHPVEAACLSKSPTSWACCQLVSFVLIFVSPSCLLSPVPWCALLQLDFWAVFFSRDKSTAGQEEENASLSLRLVHTDTPIYVWVYRYINTYIYCTVSLFFSHRLAFVCCCFLLFLLLTGQKLAVLMCF